MEVLEHAARIRCFAEFLGGAQELREERCHAPCPHRKFCIAVAPMLDRTDRHFGYFIRRVTRRTRLYNEMLTPVALFHDEAERYLEFHPSEHPVAIQRGGSELHDHNPDGRDFLANTLGAVLVAGSLREYADVWDDCLAPEASDPHAYETNLPIQAYGNGCPEIYDYDLLGVSGAEGALGNLDYHGEGSVHSFAQVVRDRVVRDRVVHDRVVPGVSIRRSAIAGFSPMTMTYAGCAGQECARDSACIVEAAADFLGATVEWMTDGADPFAPWSFECGTSDIMQETHLTGPADYLYAPRPNPFRQSATMRFSLSAGGPVELRIHDVAGRVVRTLLEENLGGRAAASGGLGRLRRRRPFGRQRRVLVATHHLPRVRLQQADDRASVIPDERGER